MTSNISRKVVRNTLYNVIGRVWAVCVTIFLTPYIIKHIGIERFGIWALVGILTGYLGLLDFGIGAAFVKHISEFYARKEYDRINQLINTGFILYLIFAAIIVVIYWTFSGQILNLLNIPDNLKPEASFVFMAGIALFGVSNAASSFGALQAGLQRMDISNIIAIALSFPSIAGTVFFLEKGYGLKGLMLNNILIFILSCGVNILVALKIFPQLKFSLSAWSKGMVSKLTTFGYRMQIAKISGFVANQTDKVLISCFLSVGLVSFYQLGSNLLGCIMALSTLLVSALMPALSEMEAVGNRTKLINTYLKSTKYLAFFVIPVFVFTYVGAFHIMRSWMGGGYEKAGAILRILSIGWLINAIAQIGAATAMAIDRPQIMSRSAVITVTLNVILSVLFIKTFGFLGVAWGTAIAVNIGTVYFFIELHKNLDVSFKNLIKTVIPCFVISLIAAVAVMLFDLFMEQSGLIVSRGGEFIVLLMSGFIFSAIYFGGTYFCKLFDREDITFFSEQISFFRGK